MLTPDVLVDVENIKQLKARYFRFLDTKNWTEWRKLFTDDLDIRVDVTTSEGDEEGGAYPPLPKGGDAFVTYMSEFLKPPFRTVHHGHTCEITITGETTATGIWAMEDIVSAVPGETVWGYGHYHERYRKVDGQWRIAGFHLKRIRFDYAGGIEDPDERTAATLQWVKETRGL